MQPNRREAKLFRIAWVLLALNAISILLFGLIAAVWQGGDDHGFIRALGVSSTGTGVLGLLIVAIPFRRRERWAWLVLWYYPLFWLSHIIFRLPPSVDVIHQYVLLTLTAVALLLSAREFFSEP